MPEIRRIRHDEAEAVVALWDQAGPLEESGRRSIAAMLVLAASSHRAACFVAVEDGRVRGAVVAELVEDGLLPCLYGRVAELFGISREALVGAAVGWLRGRGAMVITTEVAFGAEDDGLWTGLGFEREAVRWAVYPQPATGG
jgi:hypothetical protein